MRDGSAMQPAGRGRAAGKASTLGSPVLLLVMIGSTVFVSEAAVMFILSFLPPLPVPVSALLDSLTLVCLLFPVFCALLFRLPGARGVGIRSAFGRPAEGIIEAAAVYRSPALLLTITAASIFLSETVVMLLLPLKGGFPASVAALIDSLTLVAMLSPTLYLLVFRQSSLLIHELAAANERLRDWSGGSGCFPTRSSRPRRPNGGAYQGSFTRTSRRRWLPSPSASGPSRRSSRPTRAS